MQENSYFTTQFGENIKLIPGYRETVGYKMKLDKTYEKLNYVEGKPVNIKVDNFGKDVITYALLMDLLDEVGLLPKRGYERAIDLGGQEGIHAALFRGHYAKHMTSADLLNGGDPELTKKMKQIIANQKKHKLGEFLFQDNPLTAPILQKLFPGKASRRFSPMCGIIPSKKHFYDFNFKRELKVDEFVVGNFIEKVTGQFDIVLSFLTLCLVDFSQAIKKISDILPSGGVFATIDRYAWGPGAQGGVCGDFPYFEKRLTLEDMKRYYEQYHPEELQYVEKLYNKFDPKRTSTKQMVQLAYDRGLHLIAYRPLIFPSLSDTRDSYKGRIELNRDIDANEVLRDIHHFRPDIGLDDLYTSYFMMVFKKN